MIVRTPTLRWNGLMVIIPQAYGVGTRAEYCW